jgi:hypothetical protein
MSRPALHRRAGWLLAMLGAMSPVGAQDFIVNGGFAGGLAGWTLTGEGAATPSSDDIDDDPGSGSVLLRNEEASADSRTHPISQCITIEAAGEYTIGGSARVDPMQVPGRAVVGVVYYTGPACNGGIAGAAGRFIPRAAAWTPIDLVLRIDDVPRTLWLRVAVEKPGASGTLEVQVDDVYLIRGDRLFRNGFE